MQIIRRLVSGPDLVIANRNKSPNTVCRCFVTACLQLLRFLFTQYIKVSIAKTLVDIFEVS